MKRLFSGWLINVICLWVLDLLFDSIAFPSTGSLLLAALVLGILNATLKPLLKLLSLPAKKKNVNYLFEASVGGGIPILHPLTQCMAANRIDEVYGCVDLDRVEDSGVDLLSVSTDCDDCCESDGDELFHNSDVFVCY